MNQISDILKDSFRVIRSIYWPENKLKRLGIYLPALIGTFIFFEGIFKYEYLKDKERYQSEQTFENPRPSNYHLFSEKRKPLIDLFRLEE